MDIRILENEAIAGLALHSSYSVEQDDAYKIPFQAYTDNSGPWATGSKLE